jgi:uncharacterized protein DUF4242
MPKYIIERTLPPLTKEELDATGKRSVEAISKVPGVVWIKSYISESEGKIYCEYYAPNPEAILEHAKLAGLPADKISEVSLEISPAMFL